MNCRCLSVLLALTVLFSCEKIDFSAYEQSKTTSNSERSETDKDEVASVVTDAHVAILRDTLSEDKVNVMYVSLKEWNDVTSTYSEDNAQRALTIASEYKEGDMCGWHIPSLTEVQRIKAYYDADVNRLDKLNGQLEDIAATPIYVTDYKENTYRYLCAQGDSTFSFRKGYATLRAGATVKYHLRLVKDSLQVIIPSEIHFEY